MWSFFVDRGGTFTDIVARRPDGALVTLKVLSERAASDSDPVIEGIRRLTQDDVACVRMGTTVATNALLTRGGEPSLLVVNRGFADLLRIGDQARPRLFDLAIVKTEPVFCATLEITGRYGADGVEIEPLDETAALLGFQQARAQGLSACAIALIHAWRYPDHELRLRDLARQAGFTQISLSHAVSPLIRLVPRAQTTVTDAYVSPVLNRAVAKLAVAFPGADLLFMQSHGGLAKQDEFSGKDALLSGPAGGLVGAARTGEAAGFAKIISFDMGGTSTDVALYDGELPLRSASTIAGITLQTPMLAIHTVAAGGGSMLRFDGGRLRVGPESAGANPGPACYRQGGPLTVTDANVLLGKIQTRHFPALFGASRDAMLDHDVVARKFAALAGEVEQETGAPQTSEALAEGFIRIAIANMANAIRHVSLRQGQDPQDFVLNCFGGAGGQHACKLAEELGMRCVLIHPFAGLLSAYGMALAGRTLLREQAVEMPLGEGILPELRRRADAMAAELRPHFGSDSGALHIRAQVRLRYLGTDLALAVELSGLREMRGGFTAAHRARFGFASPERELVAESVQVTVTEPGDAPLPQAAPARDGVGPAAIDTVAMVSFGRTHQTPVFNRSALCAGDFVPGPAMILEDGATTIVEPGWRAELTAQGNLLLRQIGVSGAVAAVSSARPDPVLLELFNNLFMNIAEQAGSVLQNAASSVNIKERLDFSCAIFDADGNLVANAPHVPVHLGAMSESVREVLRARRATLLPGDVVALNNPFAGGTHLPDITVITPVFDETGGRLLFFSACRGHHADIGGTAPGSTPAFSRSLAEEGVVIDDFLLVQQGEFREAAFRQLLGSGRHPARNPDMNVADVKAQVAANEKARQELLKAVARFGWETVGAFMGHVMGHAEECTRRMIAQLSGGSFSTTLDDGSPLPVEIVIDREARSAIIDFAGTGAQSQTNFNAPPSITRAVVLYVFRCLAGADIPLNEGCLRPVTLRIPAGSFLSPAAGAAVVAGNTEVSQILCNALLGALGVCASSQATMNNLLFGDARLQYYETICGGAGATQAAAGASAVHTHMTNTRITDPEILEMRFPVRLEAFSIRAGSGGDGARKGGDGVIRRLRFLRPSSVNLVASRRTVAPFGLSGGDDGACGEQWIDRLDGRRVVVSGTASVELQAGDMLTVATPGGGGVGARQSEVFQKR
jgi:5-oxoprolinase (ATP-hydrolysing)